MIVLDTNVISALMAAPANAGVVAWMNRQPAPSIWTSAISVFEIELGIQLLPAGRRRTGLRLAFERMLREGLENRVLAFDEPAAMTAGGLSAGRRRAGRAVDIRDIQIAGIAAARRATLATRNVKHFEGLGLKLVNPWRD